MKVREKDSNKRLILASQLRTLAKHLDSEDYGPVLVAPGRRPVTKYLTKAQQIIHEAAPYAAKVQFSMIIGLIPHNAELFSSCDSILDRVMGRARQSIDITANEEGLLWLESIAKRM